MKRFSTNFSVLALMCAVCVGFTACNDKPDDPEKPKEGTRTEPDSYFWYSGKKYPLERVDGKYFVMFLPENEAQFEAELAEVGIALVVDEKEEFGCKTTTIEADLDDIEDALALSYYYAPYYIAQYGEGKLGNTFSLKLKEGVSTVELEALAEENHVDITGTSHYDSNWYRLACSRLSTGNALEMGNLFYETGLFDGVSYDLGGRGSVSMQQRQITVFDSSQHGNSN